MASRFHVDSRDPMPLYAQLERAIKLAIMTGAVKIGEQLPTVRELAVELRINANTVAKVYSELEAEGVLATRRGVGTFVSSAPTGSTSSRAKRAEELSVLARRFLAEAAARGYSPAELLEQMHRFSSPAKEKSHGRR